MIQLTGIKGVLNAAFLRASPHDVSLCRPQSTGSQGGSGTPWLPNLGNGPKPPISSVRHLDLPMESTESGLRLVVGMASAVSAHPPRETCKCKQACQRGRAWVLRAQEGLRNPGRRGQDKVPFWGISMALHLFKALGLRPLPSSATSGVERSSFSPAQLAAACPSSSTLHLERQPVGYNPGEGLGQEKSGSGLCIH